MTETRSRMARKKMSSLFKNCNGDVQTEGTSEGKHASNDCAGKVPTECPTMKDCTDRLSWFTSCGQERSEGSKNDYDTCDSDGDTSKSEASISSEESLNGTSLVNGIKPHSFYSRQNHRQENNSVRKQLVWKDQQKMFADKQGCNRSKNRQHDCQIRGMKRKQGWVSNVVCAKKLRSSEKYSSDGAGSTCGIEVFGEPNGQTNGTFAKQTHGKTFCIGMENGGTECLGNERANIQGDIFSCNDLWNGNSSHECFSNGHAKLTDMDSACSEGSITSGLGDVSSNEAWETSGTDHTYSAESLSNFDLSVSGKDQEHCQDPVNGWSETVLNPTFVKTPQKRVSAFPSPSSSSGGSPSPSEDCERISNTLRSSPENQASITKYFKSISGTVLESKKSLQKNATTLCVSPVGSGKRSKARSPCSRKSNDKKQLEQMYLDLGQKDFGHVTCQTCGMVYTKAQPDDEAEHIKHHKRFVSGLKFMGWKNERVVQEFHDGRVIMVNPEDNTLHTKKVEEIRKVVDAELGFAADPPFRRQESKTFLFISNKRVVGCAVAVLIDKGYPVLPNSNKDTTPDRQLAAWCCSSTPQPAQCGISRIWVFSPYRRKKIATRLLECVRMNFIYGCVIMKDKLAFSDPTPDGKRLAQSYAGTSQFLVFR